MIFENIEKLKKQYTDKYVVVDAARPELARFAGLTGTVKTVNMSGRALVEFDGYNNIGWYDIDLSFLKIVDAPPPKPEAKKEAKPAKPAAEKPAAKAAPAVAPVAKSAPVAKAAGGQSIAEILAAARSKPGGAPAAAPVAQAKPAAAPAAGKKLSPAEILAAARANKAGAASAPAAKTEAAAAPKPVAAAKPAAPAPAAKADPKKMSMAEILAAARGNKTGAAAAAPAAAPPPAAEPVAEEPAADEPAVPLATPAPAAALGGGKKAPVSSYAEMIAHCRKVDSK